MPLNTVQFFDVSGCAETRVDGAAAGVPKYITLRMFSNFLNSPN